MLYRVLERHPPSRLILPPVVVVVYVIFGLPFAVAFALGATVLEAVQLLDRYGLQDEPVPRRHDVGGGP